MIKVHPLTLTQVAVPSRMGLQGCRPVDVIDVAQRGAAVLTQPIPYHITCQSHHQSHHIFLLNKHLPPPFLINSLFLFLFLILFSFLFPSSLSFYWRPMTTPCPVGAARRRRVAGG